MSDDDSIHLKPVSNLRGALAAAAGYDLPLTILRSQAGFYLGTWNEEGPITRESAEYWRKEQQAANALETGHWTQRLNL